ncbi:hypothetical protein GE09DRAFT_1256934 [Coniochaeta sp. 2T2.1]|nr:hypothetical protein GE09DRAFT_1256934 [Coniochaeta sp. 2T2.1]
MTASVTFTKRGRKTGFTFGIMKNVKADQGGIRTVGLGETVAWEWIVISEVDDKTFSQAGDSACSSRFGDIAPEDVEVDDDDGDGPITRRDKGKFAKAFESNLLARPPLSPQPVPQNPPQGTFQPSTQHVPCATITIATTIATVITTSVGLALWLFSVSVLFDPTSLYLRVMKTKMGLVRDIKVQDRVMTRHEYDKEGSTGNRRHQGHPREGGRNTRPARDYLGKRAAQTNQPSADEEHYSEMPERRLKYQLFANQEDALTKEEKTAMKTLKNKAKIGTWTAFL